MAEEAKLQTAAHDDETEEFQRRCRKRLLGTEGIVRPAVPVARGERGCGEERSLALPGRGVDALPDLFPAAEEAVGGREPVVCPPALVT